MGWANCGTDSKGRPIGYMHQATCDHPGCNKEIDRGLSFACGGMHGETEISCERYFCSDHLSHLVATGPDELESICEECATVLLQDAEQWSLDDTEDVIRRR